MLTSTMVLQPGRLLTRRSSVRHDIVHAGRRFPAQFSAWLLCLACALAPACKTGKCPPERASDRGTVIEARVGGIVDPIAEARAQAGPRVDQFDPVASILLLRTAQQVENPFTLVTRSGSPVGIAREDIALLLYDLDGKVDICNCSGRAEAVVSKPSDTIAPAYIRIGSVYYYFSDLLCPYYAAPEEASRSSRVRIICNILHEDVVRLRAHQRTVPELVQYRPIPELSAFEVSEQIGKLRDLDDRLRQTVIRVARLQACRSLLRWGDGALDEHARLACRGFVADQTDAAWEGVVKTCFNVQIEI